MQRLFCMCITKNSLSCRGHISYITRYTKRFEKVPTQLVPSVWTWHSISFGTYLSEPHLIARIHNFVLNLNSNVSYCSIPWHTLGTNHLLTQLKLISNDNPSCIMYNMLIKLWVALRASAPSATYGLRLCPTKLYKSSNSNWLRNCSELDWLRNCSNTICQGLNFFLSDSAVLPFALTIDYNQPF